MSANGGPPQGNSAAGGGSGGSILVHTTKITGFGKFMTEGGSTPSSGGAGAGGRIGVYLMVICFIYFLITF